MSLRLVVLRDQAIKPAMHSMMAERTGSKAGGSRHELRARGLGVLADG